MQSRRPMNAANIMTTGIIRLRRSDDALVALRAFLEHGPGQLPVVDDECRVVGAVTARSLLRAALPEGTDGIDRPGLPALMESVRGLSSTKVGDILERAFRSVGPEASLAEAAAILMDGAAEGLFVVDSGGRLLGVITRREILARLAVYAGRD